MTELQLYKYIRKVLNAAEYELNWFGDELILQMQSHEIDDFMVLIGESKSEESTPISYYHGTALIDLVPICESLGINPENILVRKV
jgi:hypothetical protein